MNAPFNDSLPQESAVVEPVPTLPAAPPTSPTILPGLAQFVDFGALLVIGWASILAAASHASNEYRFGVLVVALGTILASRVFKMVGAYEFESFEHWSTGVGRCT